MNAPHAKTLLVKVPAVTFLFWTLKILSTTVGETLADTLNDGFGFGLAGSAIIMVGVLLVLLGFQLSLKRYLAAVYWATIIAISTVGTLITDNLHDNFGWQNWQSALVFGVVLAIVFAFWWVQERTLSIKTINTRKREAFYWVAILATFAMGTAGGDVFLDDLGWPLVASSLFFAAIIAVLAILWRSNRLGAVFGFWSIYVLTRPLGASLGDLLSLDKPEGLGFGPELISWIALGVIGALTIYLSISKRDVISE